MSYRHLTIEERYQIKAYKEAGYKNYKIAKVINVHPSTITRELKRNTSKITGSYIPKWADNFAKGSRKPIFVEKDQMRKQKDIVTQKGGIKQIIII